MGTYWFGYHLGRRACAHLFSRGGMVTTICHLIIHLIHDLAVESGTSMSSNEEYCVSENLSRDDRFCGGCFFGLRRIGPKENMNTI